MEDEKKRKIFFEGGMKAGFTTEYHRVSRSNRE